MASTSSSTAAAATVSGVWNRPGVDHLEAGVAQDAGDDLDAAVVAVEADLGDQTRGVASCGHAHLPVVVEAARPVLRPSSPASTIRDSIGGGVERLLELLVQALGDGQRGVEADQVGEVQRSHRVVAALDHAGVDVVGGGEPRLHHPDRRQQVRDEQGVDDEPGAVLAADHLLAEHVGGEVVGLATVSGEVIRLATSSTRRSTGTGLKKWMPITCSGRSWRCPAS